MRKNIWFKNIFIFILLQILFINISLAHPWRTDSNWCHTCRTNCSDWGLYNWEYHCHWWKTSPIIKPTIITPTIKNTTIGGSSYNPLKNEFINPPSNYLNEKIESPVIKYIENCSLEKNEIKKLQIQLNEKNEDINRFKDNEKEIKLMKNLYEYLIFILIWWILYLWFILIRKNKFYK